MHNLTTSDIAFLLCTSLSTSSPKPPGTPGLPPFRLTLTTAYGLRIDVTPTAPSDFSISLASSTPAKSLLPFQRLNSRPRPIIDSILLDSPPPTPPPQILRLSPSFRTSTYLWQASHTGHFIPVNDDLLPHLYGESWHSAYLDWVERAEMLEAQYLRGFDSEEEKESEEGERILWMVEGVLLAAWLAVQGGVDGVEYRPWGEGSSTRMEEGEGMHSTYWLSGEGVDEGVKAVLKDVGV